MAHPALIKYIKTHQATLIQLDFSKEIFMIPDRLLAKSVGDESSLMFTIETESPLYGGKLFVHDGEFYSVKTFKRITDPGPVVYQVIGEKTGIPYDVNVIEPLATPQDKMVLEAGSIINYPDGPDIQTTLGRFIANYLFFVYPFGNVFPYLNEEFTAKKLERIIAIPLLKNNISVDSVKNKYINALSLFGQSTEMFCPNITESTLTVPKHIKDLRNRLIMDNQEALKAGDPTVMSMVEQTLISAYKAYLKDDPSKHFLLKGKYWNVTLKKLLLVQGMVEVFGSSGKFAFVEQPFAEGWKQKDLPVIFNENRQGSYARAVETADGGVIAKLILRVLQDTRITESDCKTTRGEAIHGTYDELMDFLWNYIINPDGSHTLITEENIPNLIGQDLVVRTPGYCKANKGFCAKCFGQIFEDLGQKNFAPVANDFARNQTTASLKKMHGSSHSTVDVSDLSKFLL